jgi:hypothetical protein
MHLCGIPTDEGASFVRRAGNVLVFLPFFISLEIALPLLKINQKTG